MEPATNCNTDEFEIDYSSNLFQLRRHDSFHHVGAPNDSFKIICPDNDNAGIVIEIKFTCYSTMRAQRKEFVQNIINFLNKEISLLEIAA